MIRSLRALRDRARGGRKYQRETEDGPSVCAVFYSILPTIHVYYACSLSMTLSGFSLTRGGRGMQRTSYRAGVREGARARKHHDVFDARILLLTSLPPPPRGRPSQTKSDSWILVVSRGFRRPTVTGRRRLSAVPHLLPVPS